MEWYYEDKKLEEFYNLFTKHYAEIAQKHWDSLSPEDYDGCYMSTATEISEDTMDILKYSFEHNINPDSEYDKRKKVKLMNNKLNHINQEFGTESTYSWKDDLKRSISAYENQETEIFKSIFGRYVNEHTVNVGDFT